MKTPTLQALFNKSVRGLAKQKFEPAYDEEESSCTYYDAVTGRRCAIGQLMTIKQAMTCPTGGVEGCPWTFIKKALGVSIAEQGFLRRLQSAHDGQGSPTSRGIKARLRDVAREFKLKIPAVLR